MIAGHPQYVDPHQDQHSYAHICQYCSSVASMSVVVVGVTSVCSLRSDKRMDRQTQNGNIRKENESNDIQLY